MKLTGRSKSKPQMGDMDRMRTRKTLTLLSALVIGLAAASGCTKSNGEADEPRGQSAAIGGTAEPSEGGENEAGESGQEPGSSAEMGGTEPGGTAPGGTAPGGTAPGGTAPGGTAPGGTAPGGSGEMAGNPPAQVPPGAGQGEQGESADVSPIVGAWELDVDGTVATVPQEQQSMAEQALQQMEMNVEINDDETMSLSVGQPGGSQDLEGGFSAQAAGENSWTIRFEPELSAEQQAEAQGETPVAMFTMTLQDDGKLRLEEQAAGGNSPPMVLRRAS